MIQNNRFKNSNWCKHNKQYYKKAILRPFVAYNFDLNNWIISKSNEIPVIIGKITLETMSFKTDEMLNFVKEMEAEKAQILTGKQ